MRLFNLSKEIWKNSTTVKINPQEAWDMDFFLKPWFYNNGYEEKYTPTSPGWYWIGCDIDIQELESIYPTIKGKLPKSACIINELAKQNLQTFGSNSLCKKNENDCLIIYNGHQSNVIQRIRQHFMLNNDKTGAIGLRHYPMSKIRWTVSYFAKNHIQRLKQEDRSDVKRLINNKSGRVAIENAWRAAYGWPILCKE
jgi:hypothetical protein